MSSLSVPEDDRTFFERLADNWYGQATEDNVGGWEAGLANQALFGDPTEAIGYYRFDTGPGNETRDAIFSILANNLGIDNAYRATRARESGDMGWENYWKELLIGGGEIALYGYGAGGRALLAAAGKGVNLLRRARVVTGGQPLKAVTGQSLASIQRAFGTGGRFGPVPAGTVATRGGGYTVPMFGPTPATVARTGPRPITQIRPGNVVDRFANAATRFSQQGYRGLARDIGRRVIPSSRAGRFGALAGLGLLGYQLFAGGRPGAPVALSAEENAQGGAATETPPLVSRSDTTEATNTAATQARMDIDGINRQYNNILRELKSMYQLSETEEEKERLRFMLADIEAQRDAGLQAISEGYAQTVSQIQEQARISGERTAERSQRYGAELEASADRAAQRMMLQNIEQQEQYRGLSSGSQQPVNEFVGLMSAMAPAQQQYTQRMGDISREGMEWLAQTVGAQGQAQSAELQRLAAATRSGAIARQQAEVSERINRERELQRAAILDTMQRQANALQSAQQFNAGSSSQVTPLSRANTINQLAAEGYSPEGIRQYFESAGLGAFDPSEEALASIATTVPRG